MNNELSAFREQYYKNINNPECFDNDSFVTFITHNIHTFNAIDYGVVFELVNKLSSPDYGVNIMNMVLSYIGNMNDR